VVDRAGPLPPVLGPLAPPPRAAGVVDQHVQAAVALAERAGQLAHLALRGRVGAQHFDVGVAGPGLATQLWHHKYLNGSLCALPGAAASSVNASRAAREHILPAAASPAS
jgi:hypothetical protein